MFTQDFLSLAASFCRTAPMSRVWDVYGGVLSPDEELGTSDLFSTENGTRTAHGPLNYADVAREAPERTYYRPGINAKGQKIVIVYNTDPSEEHLKLVPGAKAVVRWDSEGSYACH